VRRTHSGELSEALLRLGKVGRGPTPRRAVVLDSRSAGALPVGAPLAPRSLTNVGARPRSGVKTLGNSCSHPARRLIRAFLSPSAAWRPQPNLTA